MQKYKGACHCGAITYEVETDFSYVIECNCSHCDIKGFILTFVPRSQFTLLTGEENLTEYRFNKHLLHHVFCKTCGVQPFCYANGPDGTPMAAINIRTLKDFDRSGLNIQKYDGKSK